MESILFITQNNIYILIFSVSGFFHLLSLFTGQQEKGDPFLTLLYNFHLLHRNSPISPVSKTIVT